MKKRRRRVDENLRQRAFSLKWAAKGDRSVPHLPGAAGTNRKLRSVAQVKVIAALHVDASCARACTNRSAYGSAFAAASYRADDCADSSSYGRTLYRAIGLGVIAHGAFVVHAYVFTVERPYGLDRACEL